jgi:signal transduction histidine kinase/response regulator of citrate/malate metabolism
MVWGMFLLFRALVREKERIAKKRVLMIILAMVVQSSFLIVETFKILAVTKVYDFTMPSFPIASIFIFIAIFRYKLLSTEELARDYVVDELSDAILAVDTSERIGFYNKTAESIFPGLRYNSGLVLGMIRRSMENGVPIRMKGRVYTPQVVDLSRDGKNAGKLYSLSDDTTLYEYTSELEKQKEIADEANKAKSQFLANMSHEIRTPINAVLGMDEMILRESSEEGIRAYASDIKNAGKTLLSLVNDILDFSKIEEGRMEIIPTRYELSSVINDLVNMIRARADKKGLGLNVNVDPTIPHMLFGDEIRLKQIVINLLTNAVKYTEKGEVTLDVNFEKLSDQEIGLSFKVSDTGIGMKEEDMEKLFSPFSRIEEKRNRSIEGTGLGMSIVKQLLSLMDSKLDVKSVYGEGSQFAFTVKQTVIKWEPIGDFSDGFGNVDSENTVYKELFHAPDAHILVVDDTEMNLTVIENLLKSTKINIDTACSGEEAIAKDATNDYDIIFVDHMMPKMDGIETLKHLKEQSPDKKTVYIALTANAVSGARDMYLEAGFCDYLSKPVDGRKLEEMLKEYLPKEKVLNAEGFEETVHEDIALPEELKNVEGLDIEKGLTNCGNVESYLSVVDVFAKTSSFKADEIEKLYKDKDYDTYTIKVHALKSSARIIGADELSELARSLEEAGKGKDLEYIGQNTAKLLADYRKLGTSLLGDKGEDLLKEITPAMRNEAFETIKEITESMDFGMMEQVLNDIKGYRLESDDQKAIDSISEKLFSLDWDAIKEIADERISN